MSFPLHSTTPPAAPFTTPGDICRDPYRPGDIAVVLFCPFVPSIHPAPPPRHRPILSRRLCVTIHTHALPHLGGSTPVWANTNLVPSLPLFISRGLTTPASTSLPHTSFPTSAVCVRTASQILPATLRKGPPSSCSLCFSLTLSLSHKQPRLLLLTLRLPRQRQSLLSLRQHLSLKNHQLPPDHQHQHPHTHTPAPTPGCVTSPRTTTSTRRAWTPAHTSSAHQSTATGNWPAPRVLTRGISSSRARAPCAPDERVEGACSSTETPHALFTHEDYMPGSHLDRRRQNSQLEPSRGRRRKPWHDGRPALHRGC